jgi:hypothetical protein
MNALAENFVELKVVDYNCNRAVATKAQRACAVRVHPAQALFTGDR